MGKIKVTIGLPVLSMPAWLAMESLVNQQTRVNYELIVYEDADEPNGEMYYREYLKRMPECKRLTYIYSEARVSLSMKWVEMLEYMDANSIGLLLQAADCYSEPNRIELSYQLLKEGCRWIHAQRGYFYNIKTGQMMLFNGAETGLNMAVSRSVLASLPQEDMWSSVDYWLYTNAQKLDGFKVGVIDSPTWDKGVDTDGWNRISNRKQLYSKPAAPFVQTNTNIEQVLPAEIIERLRKPEQRKLKVLNISSTDWANFSFYNAQSLRAAGVVCDGLKLKPHSFNYEGQHEVVSPNEMSRRIKAGNYDIIQVFNSDHTMLNHINGYKGKIVVYHTGTSYRRNSELLNQKLNPPAWRAIIALGEFAPLGAKDWRYVSVAVDVDKIRPNFENLGKPYRFLHCPSHAETKGTTEISEMLRAAEVNYRIDLERLDHPQSIERMRECDIYVELFKPTLDDKPYGSFGTTAVEAAALGKVVVTQNLYPEIYKETYGRCPLILATDQQDFINKVKWLNDLPERELLKLQHAHRDWAVSKHSFLATGERIKKALEL